MATRFFPNFSQYLITSPFGMRTHPVTGKPQTMHTGIDLVAYDGKNGRTDHIAAHTGGTVAASGFDPSAGYFVKIRVDGRTEMVYYHLNNQSPFKQGALVQKGQVIGYMGATGNATGAHLHFGIRHNGQWIDPKPWLEQDWPADTVSVDLPLLRKDDNNESVRAMQALLILRGFSCGEQGTDRSFGPATLRAVNACKTAHGLPADGICDNALWQLLIQ